MQEDSIELMSPEDVKTELLLFREAIPKLLRETRVMRDQLISYKEGYKEKEKQLKILFDVIKTMVDDPSCIEALNFEALKKVVTNRGTLQ